MAYYKKVLRPGEKVEYIGGLHWLVYAAPFFVLLLAVLALIASAFVEPASAANAVMLVGILLALVFALYGFAVFLRTRTTEIVVTDRRVIYKTGILGRSTVEMNISKIETVDVRQGLTGRVLGFGTVIIRGTGAGFEPLRRVRDPLALRSAILVG